MNMFKKNGGFTLVELIVVIAILAILAGVAVPAYSGYITKAQEAGDLTALNAVQTAVNATYAADTLPDSIVVYDKDAGTDKANTVVAYFGTGEGATSENVHEDADFLLYYGAAEGEDFSIDLKSATGATWTRANSDWAFASESADDEG